MSRRRDLRPCDGREMSAGDVAIGLINHDPAVPGTWRQQVGLCSCTDCALWVHRPQPRIAPKHRAQPNGAGKTGANQTERLTPATPVPGSRPCAVP